MTDEANRELRELIAEKLRGCPSGRFNISAMADAVMELFHEVTEDREQIDITTIGEPPGSRVLNQRWLVARVSAGAEEWAFFPKVDRAEP